jgi:uncharacterized glyoxalase superfamily protein PhnB
MALQSPQAWKVIPEFSSASIARTIAFYTTSLHFTIGGTHTPDGSTEASFCSLAKGEKAAANIYFRLCDVKDVTASKAWIAMSLKALELFWQELEASKEVKVVENIGDKEWGYRQFTIADPDGHELTFFAFLEGEEEEEDNNGKKEHK